MANQEHVAILKEGVEVWNQWRKEHSKIRPDLSGVTLSFANLSSADLSEADLNRADLSRTDLNASYLIGADLRASYLIGVDFSEAHLGRADLSNADLSASNLGRADLRGATLNLSNLSNADFSRADLRGATFRFATLNFANLNDANLSFSNLSDATISNATFSNTDLYQAAIGWTHFADVDLRQVKGLETLRHFGPSHISIDTIYRSEGHIPEDFLRKAGVPETFITYMRSLVVHPIDYYTCFIGYSSQDQDFAERLYADLQSKGVRCWVAHEDLKIGAKIRPSIDESIRTHDKLLLVLSEHSVNSQWVEQEVETALAKERDGKTTVLFPIRLDEAIMQMTGGWPALIRNTRHIGDFTNWKQHDDYWQAFERLLRDLQAVA